MRTVLFLAPFLAAVNGLGLIQQQLNKPIEGGKFTFYGAAGRGACGYDVVEYSAAVSGNLYDPAATWVPSSLPDGRYVLNDPICTGICVKITYKGKSATFPADNKCPECAPDHVDLSQPAFLCLEPLGGTVGIATPATIEYLLCNTTTVNTGCDTSSAPAPAPAPAPVPAPAPAPAPAPVPSPAPGPSPPASGAGSVSVSVANTKSWSGGGQVDITVTNNGDAPVCGVTLSLASGSVRVGEFWNLVSSDLKTFTNQYDMYVKKGETYGAGSVYDGAQPSFSVASTKAC